MTNYISYHIGPNRPIHNHISLSMSTYDNSVRLHRTSDSTTAILHETTCTKARTAKILPQFRRCVTVFATAAEFPQSNSKGNRSSTSSHQFLPSLTSHRLITSIPTFPTLEVWPLHSTRRSVIAVKCKIIFGAF